jgi:REP element-mobilizing transposase RayT
MEKFKNKYRISSTRLKNWDYGSNGAYFITICTQHREHYFGEIMDNEMHLNEIGQLAEKFWIEIPNHFPFIELGNFVIMPNHTHGILIINKYEPVGDERNVGGERNVGDERNVDTPKLGVSTNADANADAANVKKNGGKNEKWKPNTIGSIINQYKRIVTINARKIHADFAWQSRFHDHIIRDDASFQRIQNYITNNPLNWNKDKFHGNN